MKYPIWCALFTLALIEPTLANTTFVEPGMIRMSAEDNAEYLLCGTMNALRGDLGLILGLLIGFMGYLMMTLYNLKPAGLVMIILGICLTAFPDFFITTLNGIIALGGGIFTGGVPNPC